AGLDLVTGEITVDHFVVEQVVRLGRNGVRPGTDQRQGAEQGDEELRQLVDRRLANEAAHAGDARIVLRYRIPGRRVALVHIHGADRKSTRLNSSHVKISYA